MWPFKPKPETRESSFTDELVRQIVVRSGGATLALPAATSALESVAGIVGRAFASASVTGPDNIVAALPPSVRNLIGRRLITAGEIAFRIEVHDGVLSLIPAADFDVWGSPEAASWTYRVHEQGPSEQRVSHRLAAASVVHCRYSFDPARPWKGLGPLDHAALAGRLAAATAGALADEAAGPRGSLLPLPQTDGKDASLNLLKTDIAKLNGSVAFVESTSDNWQADGQNKSSRDDWATRRIGADPPASLVQLLDAANRDVFAACGVSPQLFAKESGAAREAWRQLLFGVIAPLGAIVAEELSLKLDAQISLEWSELRASDIQGRARALQSMVGAGVQIGTARRLAGLE